jgi:hypothetical protein
VSSSDSNAPSGQWTRHYEEAARRRRARGWHRRDDPGDLAARRRDVRFKLYLWAAVLFVAATLVAVLLPP